MSRSRGYVFTLNNYTEDNVKYLRELIEKPRPVVIYLVFGYEVAPTTNTPHLQGYIYFKNAQTFDVPKKHLPAGCHIEQQRGTDEEALTYCKKENKFEEFGECPTQGKRTDLDEMYDKVKAGTTLDEVVMENPDGYNRCFRALQRLEDISMRKKRRTTQTTGEWIYGKTGTGKSEYAFSYAPENTYVYPYDNGGWCDGYRQEKVMVIDEFRGQITFNELLRMIDKHPNYALKRRGREPLPFTTEHVIITSSLPPHLVFKNLEVADSLSQLFRRIKVYEMDEHGNKKRKFALQIED